LNPISPTPTNTSTLTPTPTPTITITPTQSPTHTPTNTSSPTVTPSVSPTVSVTPSITPSYTSTQTPTSTPCVYDVQRDNSYYSPYTPTPTPTVSSNIKSNTASSHIILSNLIPNNRYIVNLSLENNIGDYTIYPNDISFLANSSATESISVLVTKLDINHTCNLVININDLDSLETQKITKILTTNIDCLCNNKVDESEVNIKDTSTTNTDDNQIHRNTANYGSNAVWGDYTSGYVTSVGTNGHPSYYGTYDQSGNVWEWIETGVNYNRLLMGGSWKSNFFELDSTLLKSKRLDDSETISYEYGFRTATINHPNASNQDIENPGCYVTIADICNIDYMGLGSVKYEYQISKYPVTVAEYVDFLNNVANRQYILAVMNLYPFDHKYSAINKSFSQSTPSIDSGGSTLIFSAKPNMENKPITLISHINAQRYVNWLSSDMSNLNQLSINNNIKILDQGPVYTISKNTNTRLNKNYYFLPNVDEWFKAAYYNGYYKLYTNYSMYYADSSIINLDNTNKAPLKIEANNIGNGPKPFLNCD